MTKTKHFAGTNKVDHTSRDANKTSASLHVSKMEYIGNNAGKSTMTAKQQTKDNNKTRRSKIDPKPIKDVVYRTILHFREANCICVSSESEGVIVV
jgi:hypothetical protein